MEEIIYRDLSARGPVETCRDLCNGLMAHQTAMSRKHREIFGSMNFDSRLKPAFERADPRLLLVAFSGEKPVGYVFCDASLVTEESKRIKPRGVQKLEAGQEGMFPRSLEVPVVCSHLNNIFVLPEYRGRGIGKTLMEKAMAWLTAVPDSRHIFVHVSEGNDAGALYEKYGFHFSHWVCGDVIKAYVRDL